ncbi:MAG: response regulator, partial [Rhizobiales bacterium]|nr:response regulator [Hyphomicrobiales bacterium]
MTEPEKNSFVAEPRLSARNGPIPAKILAADDDPHNLLALEEILQAPGCEVVLVRSGEEALRQILREDFAVILLDVQMPRMDGYEVAKFIRGRSRSTRVPIIFLTAYSKDELHVFRGYTAGAVDYVFKPIEPIILQSKVAVFVELYRKTEEIRRQSELERDLLLENLRVRGEKLAAEQALRRAQERQEAILRSLPVVLTSRATAPPFPPLFVSDNVERLTGFPP